MDILLTIIAVVVIFSIIILLHELGHFMAARRAGIKVLEFGIGFPPRLFKKRVGDTDYTINAIPFGGFVRMLGEDATDGEILNDKHSFAGKTPWIRAKIVLAGVFMNFVLAILLLTIGFSFGIEPLLVTEADLFNHLASGNVETATGIYVSEVTPQVAELGINKGDHIVAINDVAITEPGQLGVFAKGKAEKDIDITIKEEGQETSQKIHIPLTGDKQYFGIDLKPATEFPRLAISEIKEKSASALAGLLPHDIILKMNGKEIYSPEDFEAAVTNTETTEIIFTVLRNSDISQVAVRLPDTKRVVIADVFAGSAAQKYAFLKGDIILSIDGNSMAKPENVQEILKKNPGKEMSYHIYRDGKEMDIKATAGEKNILGIALSSITSFRNTEISFYRTSVITSIIKIKKVRYAPWTAFQYAITESWRLTGLTAQAFVNTIGQIFSSFAVPQEIGGPVQIAYYTHTFVKEGFFALLRFTAILSLSLAVINVLPFPALDGGRLLFIVIEVVFKKRVNARIESMAHAIGFLFLIGLILMVTYSDVVKLF